MKKPPKTIKGIALEIAKREGKKKQVNISQISEILGHLSDIVFEDHLNGECWKLAAILEANGKRRAKRIKA